MKLVYRDDGYSRFSFGMGNHSNHRNIRYNTVDGRLMAFHKRCVSSGCFYSYSWKFLARRSINSSIRDLFFSFFFSCFFKNTMQLPLFSLLQIGALNPRVELYMMTVLN